MPCATHCAVTSPDAVLLGYRQRFYLVTIMLLWEDMTISAIDLLSAGDLLSSDSSSHRHVDLLDSKNT